jgi:hypothetical protein
MHDFTIFDLGGLIAVGFVFIKVLGPVARALAKRIEGRAAAPAADPEVHELRDELDQLQERVDFLERAIAARPPAAELPRVRTPV